MPSAPFPDGGRGPGIVMFQEIFGINDNMRALAERLAGEGYVVLVPDMFWRIEPRFERKDESGLGDAMARWCAASTPSLAIDDIAATHAHLLEMDECTGKIGAVGFCLGGGPGLRDRRPEPGRRARADVAVSYYGSAVNDMLGMVDSIECPCCSTTAPMTRSSRRTRSTRSRPRSSGALVWSSTATSEPGTPSATGMRLHVPSRGRRPGPGSAPSPSWTSTCAELGSRLWSRQTISAESPHASCTHGWLCPSPTCLGRWRRGIAVNRPWTRPHLDWVRGHTRGGDPPHPDRLAEERDVLELNRLLPLLDEPVRRRPGRPGRWRAATPR